MTSYQPPHYFTRQLWYFRKYTCARCGLGPAAPAHIPVRRDWRRTRTRALVIAGVIAALPLIVLLAHAA